MKAGYDIIVGTAFIITALALQSGVLGLFVGPGPDLLLSVVLVYGLVRGRMAGATMGFFAGLSEGLLTGGAVGVAALLQVIAGYSAGVFNKNLRTEGIGLPLSVALITSLVYQAASGLLLFVLGYPVSADRVIANMIWQPALGTTIVFLALYLTLGRVVGAQPKAGTL